MQRLSMYEQNAYNIKKGCVVSVWKLYYRWKCSIWNSMRKKNGRGCRCERMSVESNYEYEKAEATEIIKVSENDVVVSVCWYNK